MRGKFILYVNQYGNQFGAATIKELRQTLPGRCSKMYQDRKDGGTIHVGYVIGRHWLTMFVPLELPA